MDPKIAVFAVGSSWSGEAAFGCMRTRVGYCGGSKQSPEYRNIGDHAESVEIGSRALRAAARRVPTQVFGQGPDVGEQYSEQRKRASKETIHNGCYRDRASRNVLSRGARTPALWRARGRGLCAIECRGAIQWLRGWNVSGSSDQGTG
ncbi:peptide methionine sulfoxide reductase A5 [Selaginella moellendorffii]|uniref:peptide methionine sulfoxide reductase A5 n=1 Tax=Selaginella moellendorffii TaxID=88036 RepID=UPI000D1CA60B|nr:peptide methionine sulfoxide reductase A5 [Selaginella moellendorffii]|eukprot:XP_024542719.1 peptide methionine sulfoxide reductase A5 [Selaginella moellendorffii]